MGKWHIASCSKEDTMLSIMIACHYLLPNPQVRDSTSSGTACLFVLSLLAAMTFWPLAYLLLYGSFPEMYVC